MSTLRDEINEAIYRAEDGTYDVNDLTTEILALIRERLLSDDAADGGAKSLAFVYIEDRYPDQNAAWEQADEEGKAMFRAEYRAGVVAAFDVITGEQP